jgi:outer membrane protein
MISMMLVMLLAAISEAGELKVATVDLQRLMAEYYKAQATFKALKEKEGSLAKEFEKLRLEGRHLAKDAEELQGFADNQTLSSTVRQEKKKALETKLLDLRSFEIRYDDLRAQAQAELQNSYSTAQKQIVDDVVSATRRVGEKDGFNLVLNANKTNPAASDVLFSRNVDDITDKVLASLNATKPLPNPATERP